MLKLYKRHSNELYYWETWDKDDRTGIVHWGIVGQKGENKEIKSKLFSNFRKTIQKEIDQKLAEGYTEFDEHNPSNLEVEYIIEGMGSTEDLTLRQRLEEKLDGVLGWTGLGHVDGGSIGSGTMEVNCIVVDYEIAKKVIEENLIIQNLLSILEYLKFKNRLILDEVSCYWKHFEVVCVMTGVTIVMDYCRV